MFRSAWSAGGFRRRAWRSALALASLALVAGCAAPPAGPEMLGYNSANVDFFRDVLAGRLDDEPVALEGRLSLPDGWGPFPVVVWQHGSDVRNNPHYRQAVRQLRTGLRRQGIGLFLADSHTGRGIGHTAENQDRLSRASRVVDALRALEALARHPRVDAARIAIAGHGFGGVVAVWSSHEPFVRAVLGEGPRFAAHLAFYPGCGTAFERYEPTGAPLLLLLGERDDYVRAAPCVEMAATMRAAGADAEAVVYPGAHHGFISWRQVARYRLNWQFNDCGPFTVGRDGELRSPQVSSEGLSWSEAMGRVVRSGCAKQGVTIGRHDTMAKKALKRALAFLTAHLKTGGTGA